MRLLIKSDELEEEAGRELRGETLGGDQGLDADLAEWLFKRVNAPSEEGTGSRGDSVTENSEIKTNAGKARVLN